MPLSLTRETGNPLSIGARLDPEQTVATLAARIAAAGDGYSWARRWRAWCETPKDA